MNFIKKNYKLVLMFVLFFIVNCIYSYQNCSSYDTLWNYSFSHAIRIGEIPYLDFNTISTPFYSFLMSIGLFVCDDFLMFLIEHNILVTILFCIFIKMYGSKGWIMFPVLTLPFFVQLNATYNFFSFFLIVLLVYFEQENKSDSLIGILLGLLIITKHTIGLPILICSLISTWNKNKSFKRFVFATIPLLFLFVYLLITKSLFSFIDLCILGLLDFGDNNHSNFNFFILVCCFLAVVLIVLIIRNPKKISNYYALGSFSFCVPLFDWYHFGLFFGIIIFINIDKINLPGKYVRNLSIFFVALIAFFYHLMIPNKFDQLTFYGTNNLKYLIIKKEDKDNDYKIIDKYKQYDNAYMLDDISVRYDLATNKNICYFDVLLKGNFGYDGTKKMIKKISKMHDVYFFIDRKKYLVNPSNTQFDRDIIKYTMNNSLKVDSVVNFDIYYKK